MPWIISFFILISPLSWSRLGDYGQWPFGEILIHHFEITVENSPYQTLREFSTYQISLYFPGIDELPIVEYAGRDLTSLTVLAEKNLLLHRQNRSPIRLFFYQDKWHARASRSLDDLIPYRARYRLLTEYRQIEHPQDLPRNSLIPVSRTSHFFCMNLLL